MKKKPACTLLPAPASRGVMKNKKIAILGSTGSIGRNVLHIAASFPERFSVTGLTAGWNINLLLQQVQTFAPRLVSVAEEETALKLKTLLGPASRTEVVWGEAGRHQVRQGYCPGKQGDPGHGRPPHHGRSTGAGGAASAN